MSREKNKAEKLVIISAPSGSGKTTILKQVIAKIPRLEFSISATSRTPRPKEKDGKDYFFITPTKFKELISQDEFVEWEEVYDGSYYGTLNSELERIWGNGNVIIFDVDVKGGVNIKERFGDSALSIFIAPPSVEVLRERLEIRGTDDKASIDRRVARAEMEMPYAKEYDYVVVNDSLSKAVVEVEKLISDFIG